MTKTLDADQILYRAAPLQGRRAHEIQPFGHIVKMPIALGESVCEESVENLNQHAARPEGRGASSMGLRHREQAKGRGGRVGRHSGLPPRNSCDDARGDLDRAGFRPLR